MAAVGAHLRTSPSSNAGSRLSALQEKFRQQLMIEKESRLLEMAARKEAERQDIINRVTKSSAASSLSSSMSSLGSTGAGHGRVRKMFEERRNNPQIFSQNNKRGIDKGSPLEPVKREVGRPPIRASRNTRGVSMERSNKAPVNDNGNINNRSRSQAPPIQRINRGDNRQQNKLQQKGPSVVGRSLPPHHKSTSSLSEGSLKNRSKGARGPAPASPSSTKSSPGPTQPVKSFKSDKYVPPRLQPSKSENNFLRINGTKAGEKNSASVETIPGKSFFGRLGFGKSNKRDSEITSPSNGLSTTKNGKTPKYTASGKVIAGPSNGIKEENNQTPVQKGQVPGNLKSCKICGRNFAPDRLQKHEEICVKSKAKAKKRKVFDPIKLRTKGTDAEKYIARGDHLKENMKGKKNNWRKKHEDFIKTIRAAKGMKGYEAPPVDVSDYVDCPHCGRKFSEQVADRHIPKCANILSNKPSKNAKPRRF